MTVPSWTGSRRCGAGLVACCAALLASACGADGRYVVIGTASAPSASGIVEVDDIGGGSSQVAVHLEHLHPPNRLADGLTTFVVWFVPPAGTAVRAGELKYDPEARTGDLTQTSPFLDFVVRVTAERESRPAAPSDYIIATQEISID